MIDWLTFTVSVPYPTQEFWKYWFLTGGILTPILILRWAQMKSNKKTLGQKASPWTALFASLIILALAPLLAIPVCFGIFKNRESVILKRKLEREAKRKAMQDEMYKASAEAQDFAVKHDGKHMH